MADEPGKTPIQNKYAQQYAQDLATNRKEQGDITAQIARLQERLEQLQADEVWLGQAQGSLPGTTAPSEPEAEPAAAATEVSSAENAEQQAIPAAAAAVTDASKAVPQPRQDQTVKAGQPKQTTAKNAAVKKSAPAKKTATKKTTAKTTPKVKKAAAKKPDADQAPPPEAISPEAPSDKAAAAEKSGPPLWQLVLDILLKTPGQPCMAREVTDHLAQDHPARATTIQTVRNNLESLVKKNRAQKSRQQGNAMYTAYADAAAATATDDTVDGKGDQTSETAAEEIPAEV